MDIQEVQAAFREGRYRLTEHAVRERAKARLTIDDIEQAGCRAELLQEESWHQDGTRYLLVGTTTGGRTIHLVVAWQDDYLRVITVYSREAKRRR